jgi:hypothetical protein
MGWRETKQETGMNQAASRVSRWFLVRLTLRPWRWMGHVPLKCWLTFSGLHHVISKNMEIFIPTAVKTSNSAINYWFLLYRVNLIRRRRDSWCHFAKPWFTIRWTLPMSNILQPKLYECAWDLKQGVLKVKTLVVPSLWHIYIYELHVESQSVDISQGGWWQPHRTCLFCSNWPTDMEN